LKKTFQKYLVESTVVLFILTLILPHPPVYGQEVNPLIKIHAEFERGRLTADEAILKQIDLLKNHTHSNENVSKCGTPLFFMMGNYEHQLSEETKAAFNQAFLASSGIASESFISASGKFVVNYETTGSDAVPLADENNNFIPDYVEWIAEAADSSYSHYLNLGFTDIFTEKIAPYEIRVEDGGAYGFTSGNARYVGIENDFSGFPSNTDPEGNQKGAVKVTVAHELKHVIQFVQNGWAGDPDRWLEMDATLYEEVIYDDVNDYYNYLEGFANNLFGSPTSTIIPGSYEDITWALYFEERFGNTFWTNVWNRIESQSPSISFLGAIESALTDFEVSFEQATIENLLWHYASGRDNSTMFFGFDESAVYPSPRIQDVISQIQLNLSDIETLSRFSGKYFEFNLAEQNPNFVKIDILANSSNIQTGLIAYYNDLSVETVLITDPTPDELTFEETNLSWEEIDRLGVVFFNTSIASSQTVQFQVYDYIPVNITSPELDQNYPNPFNPTTTIAVTLPFSQQIKLTLYDSIGREVKIVKEGVLPSGKSEILFNASNLATGVYFYQLKSNEGMVTKKMTLIK
tara:strand:- start:32118 stop:33845 length:1728 start_codon:yes stop_codon:yes gene_type:complete